MSSLSAESTVSTEIVRATPRKGSGVTAGRCWRFAGAVAGGAFIPLCSSSSRGAMALKGFPGTMGGGDGDDDSTRRVPVVGAGLDWCRYDC